MGLFKFLDKLGGAGVKVDPAKLKPALPPVDEKPKPTTIKESLHRFEPKMSTENEAAQRQYEEAIRLAEDAKRLMKQKLAKMAASDAIKEYDEVGGCDVCGSYDYFTNTVKGTKTCRECEWDKTRAMLNSEPEQYENEGTLYDEGYNDGYAAYSPVYESDDEYMMGYKDGEADALREQEAAFVAAATVAEPVIPELSCEQGQHKFKTHAMRVDGSQYIKCENCGIIKHKKHLDKTYLG